ncbi:MAG: nucleotide pyrophosphohydrolase [Halobacteriovorax sp.]|nr:nucleotide pyrophosphohydrolase [Halobacteriovorax sp.]|tara:strand:- start:168877 stop:169242 length:366 start_codon:yes stop_codon:yes gene_type:complete
MASKEVLEVGKFQKQLSDFAKEREWEQFHSPKNIAMALSVEASELMEIFQWKTTDESRELCEKDLRKVQEEVADVFLYTMRMADLLNINIGEAIESKMEQNAQKYPVDKSRGNSKKYNELD